MDFMYKGNQESSRSTSRTKNT